MESEIVIEVDHSEAHRHPAAIREIRRILLKHLEETNRQRFPVVPLDYKTSATASAPALQKSAERPPAAPSEGLPNRWGRSVEDVETGLDPNSGRPTPDRPQTDPRPTPDRDENSLS